MRRKGFTLIELLAVIVILSAIILIALPLVSDVIESSKKGALGSTAKIIVKSIEMDEYFKTADEKIEYTFSNYAQTSSVDGKEISISGSNPRDGKVVVKENGKIVIAIHDGKYCSYTNQERTLTTEELELNTCLAKIESLFDCGDDLIDERDGNTYRTIQIGNQCWFRDNLGYNDPTCSSSTWNATAPHNACRVSTVFGRQEGLYQWDKAMNNSKQESAQGLCPAGTHIPSDAEWKELELSIGLSQADVDANGDRGTSQGQILKNQQGFNAYLPGFYLHNGNLYGYNTGVMYFTSSESADEAWTRIISNFSDEISRLLQAKNYGFSIRCVVNK